jgi:cytochrome b561
MPRGEGKLYWLRLHVALKHALFDRDGTLWRMFGRKIATTH